MILQSKSMLADVKRFLLTGMLLIVASVSVAAQTNTFPQTGNAGAGTTSPDRKLESLDSASPQLRLTHTDGSVYTDFHTIAAGNLFISPTGPDITGTKPFTVAADLDAFRFYPNADTNLRWSLSTDASGLFHVVQKGDSWVSQGTRFSINRSGNVGIGNTSPGNYRLNVSGPVAGTSTFTSYIADGLYGATAVPSRISTHNFNGGILFGYEDLGLGDYSPRVGLQQTYDVTASPSITSTKASIGLVRNGNITIRGGASHTEFFRIDNSGNVGIGTQNPGAKLHLSAGDSSFALFGPNSSWAGSLAVGSGNAFLTPISGRAQVLSSNGNLHLDAGTNQFVYIGWLNASNTIINGQGGSVGVGTSTPSYKLDVQGGQINSSGGLCIAGDCKTAWSQVGGSVSSQWTGTNSIYYNGGNVGVGATAPSEILHVGGGFLSTIRNEMSTWLAQNVTGGETDWSNNAYYSGGWKYRLADKASQIQQLNGDIRFFTAGLGAAGGGVTFTEKFTVLQGGNVGIGTAAPSAKLEVASNSAIKLGNAYFSSGGDYVHLANNEWYNGTSWIASAAGALIQISGQDVNFYRHDAAGSHTQSMNINSSGNVGVGTTATTSGSGNLNVAGTIEAGNIKAKYQDLAEWVPSSEQLPAGTVVVLDTTKSNQVVSSTQSYDTRVAGVISAQPGITLGESGAGKVLVATTGRVRVKVDALRGPIQIGDLLVTSDVAGVAMKSEAVEFGGRKMHMPGTIIGKALEPLAKGSGEILVLLSLQ